MNTVSSEYDAERYKLLQEYPPPDTDNYHDAIDKAENPAAWEKARADWEAAMKEWQRNQPPEWARAYNEQQERLQKRMLEISAGRGAYRPPH